MFDMATVLLGNHAANSSPLGKMLNCSPSSTSTTATNSPTTATNSPTHPTTPHHHTLPHNHQLHHIHIKREPGLISPMSGSENDQPPGHNGSPNNQASPASHCGSELFSAKCKRKINFSHLGIPPRGHQPATVARRNARERNRVKQVNNGFASLKQHIPLGHRAKKMSKVETLRCAVDYIRNLQGLLNPNSLLMGSGENSSQSMDAFHQLFDFGGDGGSGSLSHASTQQMSPSSSDDPSSPSYASEASYPTNNSNNNPGSQPNNGPNPNSNMYDYENYEPVSPEDEELLDAISWWQQS